ncbi:MAG: hypothetical protein KC912_15060 [Proteobacteria bacterium]|nr:hypothetical protein [Pseudomonadota bacterium]
MSVEVLHAGRFQVCEAAVVETISSNAWTVKIPVNDPIHRRLRRKPTPEGWDGAVFFIDGVETEPGLGSGLANGFVTVGTYAI